MTEIYSNATIYTVVPCDKLGQGRFEDDAEHRGGAYICDDLTQAAVVRDALNLRHRHEGSKQFFCIESNNESEDVARSLDQVEVEPRRVVSYMIHEMGIEEKTAKK